MNASCEEQLLCEQVYTRCESLQSQPVNGAGRGGQGWGDEKMEDADLDEAPGASQENQVLLCTPLLWPYMHLMRQLVPVSGMSWRLCCALAFWLLSHQCSFASSKSCPPPDI